MKNNKLKKIIALVSTASVIIASAIASLTSVSAEQDTNSRYVPSAGTETYRYYFYMPDNWYNEFTTTAGVYWWEGTDACPSWQEMYKPQVSEFENIYYIDCPTDVVKLIFNNFVDGGDDPSAPIYTKTAQTFDTPVGQQQDDDEFWAYFPEIDNIPGDSDLYPEGLATFDNMIYVIDSNKIDINPHSQRQTCRGEWYYYYGKGEYGYAPTKGEGAIYTGCYKTIDEAIEDKLNGVKGSVTNHTEPTTKNLSVAPLTVNATSNFFPEATAEYNEDTKEVTVTYTLDIAKDMVCTEWYLTYDPNVLSFDKDKNSDSSGEYIDVMPQIGKSGSVCKADTPGTIAYNASSLGLYEISAEQPFVKVTFDVVGEGETTIDFQVRVLAIGNIDENTLCLDPTSFQRHVEEYVIYDVEGIPAPVKNTELTPSTFVAPTEYTTEYIESTTAYISPTTEYIEPTTKAPNVPHLKVNATSNFFPIATAEYNEETKEVTVTYKLGLAKKMLNTEWYLTYDETVLSFDKEKNRTTSGWTIMPQIETGAVYITDNVGTIICNASSLSMYKIVGDQPFVQVTFDVIGEGETTIDLQVRVLSIGDADPYTSQVDQNSIKYYASQYEVWEVEGVAEPTKKTELTRSTFISPTEPLTQAPTTSPVVETQPTEEQITKIYFDVESSGWENYKYIYCHIWRADGTGNWPYWQSRKELCTKEEDGIYSFDLTQTGNTIKSTDGKIYYVIFSANTGIQTYNMIMSGSCLGDTVYVTGNTFENPDDPEKRVIEAAWKNNPDCGAHKVITSTGNVVGTALADGESDEMVMADYLRKYYRDNTKMFAVQDLFYELVVDKNDVLDAVQLKEIDAISKGLITYGEAYNEYRAIEEILRRIFVDNGLVYDINMDKSTDIKDVTALQMYIARFNIEVRTSKLDVNGNDVVEINDATALQFYLIA